MRSHETYLAPHRGRTEEGEGMTSQESRLRCMVDDKGWTFGDEERAAVAWALKVIDSFQSEREDMNRRISEVCRENRQIKETTLAAIAQLQALR